MKKIKNILFIACAAFLVSCSSSGGGEVAPVLGCMDDCAVNYNSEATQADPNEACMYSFLGTYEISDWTVDGISIYSSSLDNPAQSGFFAFDVLNNAQVGIYTLAISYEDGTISEASGTFENTQTQLLFDGDSDSPLLWNTTKLNCTEFDGNTMSDGLLHTIELTYVSNNTRIDKNSSAIESSIEEIFRK